MTAPVVITRPKLAKVLALMSSNHDGEVLAAARMAERMRRDAGVTWDELLVARHEPERRDWRTIVNECLAQPDALSLWELHFLRSLQTFRHVSPKQAAVLHRIAGRVLWEDAT